MVNENNNDNNIEKNNPKHNAPIKSSQLKDFMNEIKDFFKKEYDAMIIEPLQDYKKKHKSYTAYWNIEKYECFLNFNLKKTTISFKILEKGLHEHIFDFSINKKGIINIETTIEDFLPEMVIDENGMSNKNA